MKSIYIVVSIVLFTVSTYATPKCEHKVNNSVKRPSKAQFDQMTDMQKLGLLNRAYHGCMTCANNNVCRNAYNLVYRTQTLESLDEALAIIREADKRTDPDPNMVRRSNYTVDHVEKTTYIDL